MAQEGGRRLPEYKIPQSVVNAWATRRMRNHHFVWHNVREQWNRLLPEDQERIRALGWAPPRPALLADGTPMPDNGAGEDFLYFHRTMIDRTNRLSQRVCPYARVVGFDRVPPPGDERWPVPPVYDAYEGMNFVINLWKGDDFYNTTMRVEEEQLNDPAVLRNMTLGQLGSRLEFGIHTHMHVRWSSANSVGYRNQPNNIPVPDNDVMWDDPRYNWLADFFSAHVNRIFWKIHGWVDNKIEQWREANGMEEIEWNYTWIGGDLDNVPSLVNIGQRSEAAIETGEAEGVPDVTLWSGEVLLGETGEEGATRLLSETHDHMNHGSAHDNLDEVLRILLASGKCRNFYMVPEGPV